ncbi:hemolysin XhlA family protein [Cytobacillus firmus]|uniref:hemolysin XhlA family protein n=1 Tax=Cytobacillus firmus TaxID=1399 RepID=UPI0020796EC4|nr:hemolysin XhlA family protein [Cytobacillus firmus]USK40179.1 hemolysin XhlA family protein [Cytobacillus firmus]
MTQEAEAVDIWKESVRKEIDELKSQNVEMKGDIRRLQDKTLLQDRSIQDIQGDLKEIKEDTKWLKRTITAALITALCTGVIGGGIAIIFTVFKGGS